MSSHLTSCCNKVRLVVMTQKTATLSRFLRLKLNVHETYQKTDTKFKFSIPVLPRIDKQRRIATRLPRKHNQICVCIKWCRKSS